MRSCRKGYRISSRQSLARPAARLRILHWRHAGTVNVGELHLIFFYRDVVKRPTSTPFHDIVRHKKVERLHVLRIPIQNIQQLLAPSYSILYERHKLMYRVESQEEDYMV